jgi:ATP-binding cassette subfamily B protein
MTKARHVLAPYLRRQWRALGVAAISTIAVAAAEVLRPFPLKFVIDHLFAGGDVPDSFDLSRGDIALLAGVAGLVLAIALFEAVGGYLMDVRLTRAGERIVHDLRVAIYAHLHRLSLDFHQRAHTGDLVTRVTGDVSAVGTMFSSSLGTLVSSGLMLIGMVVVGFILDPLLALVAFATTPVLAVIAFRFRRRMKKLARRQRTMEGEIASLAAESLSAIEQVKALGVEDYEHERLEQKSRERLKAGYKATVVEGRFTRVIDVLGAVGTAAVLVVGVFRVEAGALSPGDLVVMVAYTRRMYRPLRLMAREWVRLSRAMARAEQVAEVLATDDVLEEGGRTPVGRARGEITFEDVTFGYDDERPVLSDVSLTISAGAHAVLVGPSGAGKSTLAALAARFYDPDSGRVLIDGVDAREYPLQWLRDQVGVVLQDPVVFTGTITENIAWGTDATEEDVVRAAQAVGADGFIRALPDGYETELDPGGIGVSGGQRQRIAIARTLLRDPAILLLDEPTTGLDAASEAEVLKGLDVLMRDRTTVIITHALGLARRADQVIVLDDGRIAESGPPADLLAEDGAFRPSEQARSGGDGDGLRDLVRGLGELLDRTQLRRPLPELADPALPQTRVLLDPEAVAPVLARALRDGRTPDDVRVRYLRYKPGTNLVVHYDVAANGSHHDVVGMIAWGSSLARRAEKPESVTLARLVGKRLRHAVPLTYDDDVGCLIQWYPLDLSLPALAIPPGELRRLITDAGIAVPPSNEEPQRLSYKPRRRAVLRVDGHVVRLYARRADFESALRGQRAASTLGSLVAPRLEVPLPHRLLTVQSLLRGEPVRDGRAVAAEAGALLADLHASEPPELGALRPEAQLQAARTSAWLVGTIVPELRPRVEEAVAAVTQSMPGDGALVPSHGDFHAEQLLFRDGALAVTDFDEFCRAAPAFDLATYAVHLVFGDPGNLDAARAALDDLVEGYGARPADLQWYLATMILREAPRPFRYFEADWRLRVEQMVAAAEEALST